MTGAAALVHGMGLEPVAPDWPPLTAEEVGWLLGQVTPGRAGHGCAGPGRILWRSPRPFAASALVGRPGRAGAVDGRLFVKRHHRAVRSPEALREEHDFLRHLAVGGCPVPAVDRPPRAGTTRPVSAWQRGPWTYEVHEALAGDDRYRDRPSWTPFLAVDQARAAGRALALLHLAADGYAAAARRPAPLLVSMDLVGSADLLGAIEDRVAARPALASALAGRSWRDDVTRQLLPWHARLRPLLVELAPRWTHGDWHPSNLLWSDAPSGPEVVGVVDLGLCNRTTAVHDLATAIERSAVGWLSPASSRRGRLADALALVEGYQSVRPLLPGERRSLAPLLPLVHVEFALSELEYFHAVVGAAAGADLAYAGYLLGHAAWFAGREGRRLLAAIDG